MISVVHARFVQQSTNVCYMTFEDANDNAIFLRDVHSVLCLIMHGGEGATSDPTKILAQRTKLSRAQVRRAKHFLEVTLDQPKL